MYLKLPYDHNLCAYFFVTNYYIETAWVVFNAFESSYIRKNLELIEYPVPSTLV